MTTPVMKSISANFPSQVSTVAVLVQRVANLLKKLTIFQEVTFRVLNIYKETLSKDLLHFGKWNLLDLILKSPENQKMTADLICTPNV